MTLCNAFTPVQEVEGHEPTIAFALFEVNFQFVLYEMKVFRFKLHYSFFTKCQAAFLPNELLLDES